MESSTAPVCETDISLPQQLRPIALANSELRHLPVELIQHINSFLPLDASVCFSLSCCPIYNILGQRAIRTITPSGKTMPLRSLESLKEFLKLLAKDLPNHIACYNCELLHTIDGVVRYSRQHGSYFGRPCMRKDQDKCYEMVLHSEFSSTIMRMATKRYQQGRDCSELLKYLSPETNVYHRGYELSKAAACLTRIAADGSVIYRDQMVMLAPAILRFPFLGLWVHICSHITFGIEISYVEKKDESELEWDYADGEPLRAETRGQCQKCILEYQVDLVPIGNHHKAIIVTKWIDFGQGLSPEDPFCRDQLDQDVPEFKAGSICARFEGKHQDLFKSDQVLNSQDWCNLVKAVRYY